MRTRLELEALSSEEREIILRQMSAELTTRLLGAEDFDREIETIIDEFNSRGHNLVMFDTDGDWQRWCGDWTVKHNRRDMLILYFDPVEGAEAEWSHPQ